MSFFETLLNPFGIADKAGVKRVVDTFSAIGGNIASGNLLGTIPVAEKYENTILGKAAEAITSPAAIAAIPAVVATAKVVVAPAVKSALKSSTAKTAATQIATNAVTGQQTNPQAPVASYSPPVSSSPLPPNIPEPQKVTSNPTAAYNTPPATKQPAIQQEPAPTSFLKDATTLVSENPIVETIPTATPQKATKARKTPTKRAKVASKKRRKAGKKRQRQPRTAGKRKDTSKRRIRYTKNNQPYVIMASGKARFIKKSSARNSRKRKGGKY